MPRLIPYGRATTAALAVCAALSLASAPEEATMASGQCIEAHAYVSVNGTSHGITEDTCLLPTDCPPRGGIGPIAPSVGPVGVGAGVTLAAPNSTSNLDCAL